MSEPRAVGAQLTLFPGDPLTVPPRPVVRPTTGAESPVDVEVRVSARRRKSAVSYWEGRRIVVVVPSHLRGDDRDRMVAWLVDRARSQRPGATGSDEILARRARLLADRYVDGVRPASVRWVRNQSKRWGSCSAATGEIRISHRLQHVPEWVLDAVVVHELAHLVHPDHSADFHRLANRFGRQREASLFLDGYTLGLDAAGDDGR